jgi:CubicO group peptidase (beta-lactamase class C family)
MENIPQQGDPMRNSPAAPRAARLLGLALAAASALALESALAAPPAHAQASPVLPASTPAGAGMSMERLDRMRDFFRGEVDKNSAAGYVLMVARGGKLVYSAAIGMRDRARQVPMTFDTRFRIASMTKPITAAAVLMLYEEGRFHLDDPVSRFLPEFANERVFTGVDAQGGLVTEAAKEPITIRHLLTHSAGLGYVFDYSTPLGKAYNALPITPHSTLADVIRAIAGAPLYFEPGAGWRYSYADDVLGRLVEAVSGMSFERFLKQRLFEPLGMTHTGFSIPESDLPLLATLYKHNSTGELEPSDPSVLGSPTDPSRWPSGGGGLISTAGDYLRFAQMLENGGALNGKRILSPVTVALMSSNQVPEDAMLKFWGPDSRGLGYGLGIGVVIDAKSYPQAGFVGDYSWGGFFDTHWVASPRSGVVAVLMTQVDPRGNQAPQRTDPDFRNLLFASVERIDPPPAHDVALGSAAAR